MAAPLSLSLYCLSFRTLSLFFGSRDYEKSSRFVSGSFLTRKGNEQREKTDREKSYYQLDVVEQNLPFFLLSGKK